MAKLISIGYIFLFLILAALLDFLQDSARRQAIQTLDFGPLAAVHFASNLVFAIALVLLVWMLLSRFEKNALVSALFFLVGAGLAFSVSVISLNETSLPDAMIPLAKIVHFIYPLGTTSYFSIADIFIPVLGLAGLIRKGEVRA